MNNAEVKRVIVVSKTHLDVGFTDYAQTVLDQYVNRLIPSAVELAFSVNTPERKRFVWTVGAFLIRYYLTHAEERAAARLCEALSLGYVRWHALPLTTHTELMSEGLFRYGLSISAALDKRFGFHTIAAKMTDVPGHTAAMLPLLHEAGVTYLHIGVNASSRVPNVPPLFLWKYGEHAVAVNYAGGYGDATVLENGVALEFLHTHDNFGPPTKADLDAFYARLKEKYQNAHIEAGSLDDFAASVAAVRDTLPVVDEEIGDTWIHGVASDPLKTARLKRLLPLADQWVQDGRVPLESSGYDALMENLLLVCEHTWGMDVKKHLLDFSNWKKADFLRAMAANKTDYSFYGASNRHILLAEMDELRCYRGDSETSSYAAFTRSHLEQRAYLDRALDLLPQSCKDEAASSFAYAYPAREGKAQKADGEIAIGAWRAVIGGDGALTSVCNDALFLDQRGVHVGGFSYQSFGGESVEACFRAYGRNLDENFAWAVCDFSKPGLRLESEIQDGLYVASVDEILLNGNTLTAFMHGDHEAAEQYGCPRELALSYRFLTDEIEMTLYWRGKDPIRSPEALWLSMRFAVSSPARWQITKLCRPISPVNVVSGGNRKLHAAEALSYHDALHEIDVRLLDAPLVSVGARNLYRADDSFDSPANGFYMLLCNNRWGTNFPQWFGEDMRFCWRIRFGGRAPVIAP